VVNNETPTRNVAFPPLFVALSLLALWASRVKRASIGEKLTEKVAA